MAKNIYAERWTTSLVSSAPGDPFLHPGIWQSPGAQYNANKFAANGMWKSPVNSGPGSVVPNAFQQADAVLVRRVRLWSPACALGLVGGNTDGAWTFRIHATRFTGTYTAQAFVSFDPHVLGEWIDVNEMIDASNLGPAPGPWTFGLEFDGMTLDGSRINPALTTPATSFLNMVCQIDLAHSLPGVVVP